MTFSNLLLKSQKSLQEMHMESLKNIGLERTLDTYYLIGFPYPPLLKHKNCINYDINSIIQYKNLESSTPKPINLYFHFPFCRVVGKFECSFCHFFKERHNVEIENEVVNGWIKELKLYKSLLGTFKIETIYFGGGSVALIQPSNLLKILDYLQKEMNITSSSEIKFEIYSDAFKDLNQLSSILNILKDFNNVKIVIDAQSLNPLTIKYISWGRITQSDYFKTIDIVSKKGFNNICTGFILGLPFESPDSFLNGLSRVAMIPQVKALNVYPLMIKSCDHVINFLKNAPEILFDVTTRDYVSLAYRSLLESFGFTESPLYFYNRDCNSSIQQTNKYAAEKTLLGIGPSSFGFIVDSKLSYYNIPSCRSYIESINNNVLPIWKYFQLNNKNMAMRSITHGGINMLNKFSVNSIPCDIEHKIIHTINILKKYNLIEEPENGVFSLTKKGILRAEEIAYYLADIDLQFSKSNDFKTEQSSPFHYFPSRTDLQLLNWSKFNSNFSM